MHPNKDFPYVHIEEYGCRHTTKDYYVGLYELKEWITKLRAREIARDLNSLSAECLDKVEEYIWDKITGKKEAGKSE